MADAKAETKDEVKKEALFKAGTYMNAQPRVLNITSTTEGGETRIVVPGRNVDLTEDDVNNKHIHHLIKHGELIESESAEARNLRETEEAKQRELEAAAAKKAGK